MLKNADFKRPLHVFAPNIKLNAELIAEIGDGSDVVAGNVREEAVSLAKARDIRIFDMMKSERFQAVNSCLTAEGALMIAIQRSNVALCDQTALILGFGRMGAAVLRLFSSVGVTADIATSNPRPALAFARNAVDYATNLGGYGIIVNTVPHPVISDKTLLTASEGTVYIDLASSPAVNLEYARYLGLDADIYPALPAKVCPVSAAKAISAYISEVII